MKLNGKEFFRNWPNQSSEQVDNSRRTNEFQKMFAPILKRAR